VDYPGTARLFPVIPGRAEGANPESRSSIGACVWIPDRARCARLE
jgi:hypothetical protein